MIKILNYFISQFLDLQSLKPPLEWNYLHQKGVHYVEFNAFNQANAFLKWSFITIPPILRSSTGKTVKQNAYEQTKEVLSLIDKLLAEIGSEKSKILTTQIFLADMADYAQLNQAWDEWVDSQNPPSRATVEAKLADPDWKVEIVIIAAV